MSELPKIVRARLKAEPSGDHPDPNLLAAFAEQALPDRERAPVLLHVSRCADCRDLLALAVPPADAATDALDTTTRVRVFRWSILRWGAVAACVVIVGSAVLMKRYSMRMLPESKIVAMRSEEEVEDQDRRAADAPLRAPLPHLQDQVSANGAHEQAFVSGNEEASADKGQAVAKTAVSKKAPPPKALMITPDLSASRVGGSGVGHAAGGFHGAVGGAAGGGVGAAYAYGAMPGAPAKPANHGLENKSLPTVGRNVTDLTALPPQSQTVEVQAQAQAIETEADTATAGKQETPGRAKSAATPAAALPPASPSVPPAKSAPLFDRMTPQSSETVTTDPAAMAKESANRERMVQSYAPVSRWTISSDGQLEHSIDSGKTWQPMAVADNATFRALSANGPDLWVGGASGLLYHSSDAGGHWTRVKPAAGSASLSADIAAIEFTDTRHGKITASTGQKWLTDDAGETWHTEQ